MINYRSLCIIINNLIFTFTLLNDQKEHQKRFNIIRSPVSMLILMDPNARYVLQQTKNIPI